MCVLLLFPPLHPFLKIFAPAYVVSSCSWCGYNNMFENFEIQTMKYSVVNTQCRWGSVIENTTDQTTIYTSIYFLVVPCSAISRF